MALWFARVCSSVAGRGWYSLGHISPASDGAERMQGGDSWGSLRQFPYRRQGRHGLTIATYF